jgi:hypothetical protein
MGDSPRFSHRAYPDRAFPMTDSRAYWLFCQQPLSEGAEQLRGLHAGMRASAANRRLRTPMRSWKKVSSQSVSMEDLKAGSTHSRRSPEARTRSSDTSDTLRRSPSCRRASSKPLPTAALQPISPSRRLPARSRTAGSSKKRGSASFDRSQVALLPRDAQP